MSGTGAPPIVPVEFRLYDSYAEAPEWQLKVSMVWVAAVGISILFSLPHLVRSIRTGRAYRDFFGLSENVDEYLKLYDSDQSVNAPMAQVKREDLRKYWLRRVLNAIGSVVLWTIPKLELNVGQLLIIIGYLLTIILCAVLNVPLVENSNRAGFIALAQFPVVFLFATKNSIVSLLLGPGNGYEKLNFIHRWSGRGMFIACAIHGGYWIKDHLKWGFPIMGEQKETCGVAALGLLCVIIITSFRPVRKAFYEFFYVVHLLAFVAFYITICYHTIYAAPWIIPPLAFFGMDLLLRFLRVRIKDAVLTPITNEMTLISIPFCTGGWTAGQHVRLRVFFDGRIFESHPFTILNAPPSVSCIKDAYAPGITLGVRAVGDWSRALNAFALNKGYLQPKNISDDKEIDNEDTECCSESAGVPVQVMIDGPYGGCCLDLGDHETVLLFSGGAGATFAIGVLDDIVGRCVRLGRPNGEKTRRIEFAWCVKSFGSIDWFAPALIEIAHRAASSSQSYTPLSLHISVYVTCLCNPEAVPPIPNCDVTILRPDIHHILQDLVTPPPSFTTSSSHLSLPIAEKDSSRSSTTSPPRNVSNVDDQQEDEIVVVSKQRPGHVTTAPIIGDPNSSSSSSASASDIESSFDGLDPHASRKLPWLGYGGGVAVCASGPVSLMREAMNAVARLKVSERGREMGGVDIHTEVFAL